MGGLLDKGSKTTVEIPDEIRGIYEKLGTGWTNAMDKNPLWGPEGWWQAVGKDDPRYGGNPMGTSGAWSFPRGGSGKSPFTRTDIFPGGGEATLPRGNFERSGPLLRPRPRRPHPPGQ